MLLSVIKKKKKKLKFLFYNCTNFDSTKDGFDSYTHGSSDLDLRGHGSMQTEGESVEIGPFEDDK